MSRKRKAERDPLRHAISCYLLSHTADSLRATETPEFEREPENLGQEVHLKNRPKLIAEILTCLPRVLVILVLEYCPPPSLRLETLTISRPPVAKPGFIAFADPLAEIRLGPGQCMHNTSHVPKRVLVTNGENEWGLDLPSNGSLRVSGDGAYLLSSQYRNSHTNVSVSIYSTASRREIYFTQDSRVAEASVREFVYNEPVLLFKTRDGDLHSLRFEPGSLPVISRVANTGSFQVIAFAGCGICILANSPSVDICVVNYREPGPKLLPLEFEERAFTVAKWSESRSFYPFRDFSKALGLLDTAGIIWSFTWTYTFSGN